MKKIIVLLLLAGNLIFPLTAGAQTRGDGYCKVTVNGRHANCSSSGTVTVTFFWSNGSIVPVSSNYTLGVMACTDIEFSTLAQMGNVFLQTATLIPNDDSAPVSHTSVSDDKVTLSPNRCSSAGNWSQACAYTPPGTITPAIFNE